MRDVRWCANNTSIDDRQEIVNQRWRFLRWSIDLYRLEKHASETIKRSSCCCYYVLHVELNADRPICDSGVCLRICFVILIKLAVRTKQYTHWSRFNEPIVAKLILLLDVSLKGFRPLRIKKDSTPHSAERFLTVLYYLAFLRCTIMLLVFQ